MTEPFAFSCIALTKGRELPSASHTPHNRPIWLSAAAENSAHFDGSDDDYSVDGWGMNSSIETSIERLCPTLAVPEAAGSAHLKVSPTSMRTFHSSVSAETVAATVSKSSWESDSELLRLRKNPVMAYKDTPNFRKV
jgi:hypothetical protein